MLRDRHGDLIREIQRARIFAAVAALACERGHEAVTVREITARAGVSRRRFYELFDSSRECFEATIDDAIARAGEQVGIAQGAEREWLDRLRAGLASLLAFFDSEPELAKLCLIGATAAGPSTLARRREVLTRVAEFVDEGRDSTRPASQPPPLTAESLVGGALGVVQARLLEPQRGPLLELLNPLMSVIVLAYRGPRAAQRELSRPAPSAPALAAPKEWRYVVDLDLRVTYRTLRVLSAIAASPGLSNRQVAEAAGVRDAGQISKLLGRLERHGLIENTGEGQARGASNAWRLTSDGQRLERHVGASLSLRARNARR